MPVTIREARVDDHETITAFNAAIAMETESKALDVELVKRAVCALFEDASKGRYWVAESDDRIVGQLMVTYEWSDWRNGNVWWIQSVYIHPDFRRQGVYTALYEFVRSEAEATPDACGIRLYVEKHNERAIRTYAALGMTGDTYLVMESMFKR